MSFTNRQINKIIKRWGLNEWRCKPEFWKLSLGNREFESCSKKEKIVTLKKKIRLD